MSVIQKYVILSKSNIFEEKGGGHQNSRRQFRVNELAAWLVGLFYYIICESAWVLTPPLSPIRTVQYIVVDYTPKGWQLTRLVLLFPHTWFYRPQIEYDWGIKLEKRARAASLSPLVRWMGCVGLTWLFTTLIMRGDDAFPGPLLRRRKRGRRRAQTRRATSERENGRDCPDWQRTNSRRRRRRDSSRKGECSGSKLDVRTDGLMGWIDGWLEEEGRAAKMHGRKGDSSDCFVASRTNS
jgi:hypothetical protein